MDLSIKVTCDGADTIISAMGISNGLPLTQMLMLSKPQLR